MTTLSDWAAAEADATARAQRDDDAHVECKNRFDLAVTVQLCLRFSEQARSMCDQAWTDLDRAIERAQRSIAYLNRTTATLEQAVRLQAMGRR